jgi:hypothetical protein
MHVWECGEWRETGKCSRGGKCGLRHVLRAEKGRGNKEEAFEGLEGEMQVEKRGQGLPREAGAEGGFEEQSEYIGFGEQGSPEEVEPSDEEREEGGEEEDGGSGDDGESHEGSGSEDGEDEVNDGQDDEVSMEQNGEDSPMQLSHGKDSLISEPGLASDPMETDDEADEDAVLDVVS